jgi:hypothetical protein
MSRKPRVPLYHFPSVPRLTLYLSGPRLAGGRTLEGNARMQECDLLGKKAEKQEKRES